MADDASTGRRDKVFVSYSRQDLDFANALAAGLERHGGYEVLIDRIGIGHGADWRERLAELILECDSVVFVLSPDSIASEVCAWEVEEARRRLKRILPVLWREVDFDKAPPGLSALNAVPFVGVDAITGLSALIEALAKDLDWLRDHSRLEQRAAEWDQRGRRADELLRGAPLKEVQAWRERKPATSQDMTDLQRAYLQASEEEETRVLSAERRRLNEIEAARRKAEAAQQQAEAARIAEAAAARTIARRTLAALVVAALLAVGATAAGVYFFQQNQRLQFANLQLRGLGLFIADTNHAFRASDAWFQIATQNKLSIGLVRARQSYSASDHVDWIVRGSGFLVRGESLHETLAGEVVFITAAHVLLDPIDRGEEKPSIDLARFQASFPAIGFNPRITFSEVLFFEPASGLDIAILRLEGKPQAHTVAVDLTSRDDEPASDAGLAVLHWDGRYGFTLGVGHRIPAPDTILATPQILRDRYPSDMMSAFESGRMVYTHMTAEGSSGAPVFNANTGRLVCLHQWGRGPASSTRPWGACVQIAKVLDAYDALKSETSPD